MARRSDAAYYDAPQRNRWDRARFDEYARSHSRPASHEREIDIRISEGHDPSHHAHTPSHSHSRPRSMYSQPQAQAPRPVALAERPAERERYWERDRFAPPDLDRRRDFNVYWEEPTPQEVASRALAPYRRKDYYDAPPARPQYLRRQSSLDTFDRRPVRGYDEHWRPPAYVAVPLPYRHDSRPSRRYDDDWEEVRWRDRDLSPGWEEEYRDVRVRRRGRSKSKRRRRSRSVSSSSSSSSSDVKSVTTAKSGKSRRASVTVEKTVVKDEVLIGKKGKTRMPKRLVHKQVIIDMGLPFDEEDFFIIVHRALEKEHIDDIIKKSEGFRDTKVTYKYSEEIKEDGVPIDARSEVTSIKRDHSAPPAPPAVEIVAPPPPPAAAPSCPGSVVEEKITRKEIVEEVPQHGGELVMHHHHHRSDRSIRDEIRALEAEREALRLERRADRRLLEAERLRENEYEWELVERRESRPLVREEVVRVEKDRRGRLALVSKKVP